MHKWPRAEGVNEQVPLAMVSCEGSNNSSAAGSVDKQWSSSRVGWG